MSSQADPMSGAVSWITAAVANGAGWMTSDFAGQIVSFVTLLVFGGVAIYTRVMTAIDNRRIANATLPIRVRIEAERLERESKANAATGEHVVL